MIHRSRTFWAGLIAVATLASASSADVLYLKTGGRLEGVLTHETAASLTLDIGMGQVSVPRDSVRRIERKDSALSEYRRRLSAIAQGDVTAFADLARFAGDHGLRSESRLMWARVLSLDPRNVEGHLALGHVLMAGNYVDEAEAYRAQGFLYFEGRWMTPPEQAFLLREREQRASDDRQVDRARREARDAEERALRAEREAARARAEVAAVSSVGYPVWGYGSSVIVGSRHWGGYTAGCSGLACTTVPQIWSPRPPAPVPTPLSRTPPVQPRSIR